MAAPVIDLDSSSASAPSTLPMWALHRLPVPPTLWGRKRADAFDDLTSDERFQRFQAPLS
jgi:hypothetical protein